MVVVRMVVVVDIDWYIVGKVGKNRMLVVVGKHRNIDWIVPILGILRRIGWTC